MDAPPTFEQRLAEVSSRGQYPGGLQGPPLVRLRGAARSYGRDAVARVALRQTDCQVFASARIALMGPSGSGKSTLLHLMAGLDEPTVGTVEWPAIGGPETLRPGPIALIFQGPSLIPSLSVAENVALPLLLAGADSADAGTRAELSLARLGLASLGEKLPEEISGGQAQRVAVCRALAGEPVLILADEPTGQLDRSSGLEVVDLLVEAADHADAALLLSTHDPAIASRMPLRWELTDGVLSTDAEPLR